MKYIIRPAVATDEKRICELYVEMLQTVYHTKETEGYKTGELDKFWSGYEDRIFVAEDEAVVGFLSVEVYHEDEDYVYLNDFAVTEGYRNKGIGSALLEAAESYAQKINILKLCLHVEKTNLTAMRFYQKSGYAIYRDDGHRYLMNRELSPRSDTMVQGNSKRKRFLAVFSGFPDHHFPEEIAKRLREELTQRKSIVFITACPLNYRQNDDDCEGMHEMFAEQNLPFEKHCVIDKRTDPSLAKELVNNADCVFLMGGGACREQLDLIREKGCYEALLNCHVAVLGVSAGSMNMAKNTVDFIDSMEPFEGLGFTDITVSCHHDPKDKWRYEKTLRMSEDRVVYAMEDMSAIFIKEGKINTVGKIYRAENRKLNLLAAEDIQELEREKATRNELARVAKQLAEIPLHGNVNGMESNLEPIVRLFPTWNVKEADGLWCAAFVYYCCLEAGFEIPYRPEECKTCHLAGCLGWEEFAIGDQRIEYHKGTEGFDSKAGDIVIYDRVFENKEHDHIGIVLEKRENTILAAEGNINNRSGIIERPADEHIRAYIRIPDGYRYEDI
ncbi:MAG: GNAT family N-acetyltransferase [Erysipelotrichaceae bacterium]|nr:GNAT family N-acetyltransferase [Erysipelotrichaceae bacterium]